MADWLDSLSEDWESQPRSSSPRSNIDAHGSANGPINNAPHQKSRIPRSRNSLSSSTSTRDSNGIKPVALPKRRSALAERSLSEINIRPSQPIGSMTGKPGSGRTLSRSFSDVSAESMVRGDDLVQGSVQVSPSKARNPEDTPEWRRRLIKGQMGYRDQKDLFSPMGLESMFQKPRGGTLAQKSQRRKSRLPIVHGSDAMPSSPPPWPSTILEQDDSALRNNQKRGSEGMEILEEHDSAPSQGEDDTDRDAERSNWPDGNGDTFDDMAIYPSDRRPSKSSAQTTFRDGGVFGEAFANASRQVSAETEITDGFSPVYIGKHSAADGRVSYQALDLSKSQREEQLRKLALHATSSSEHVMSEGSHSENQSDTRLTNEVLPENLPTGTPDTFRIGSYVNIKRGGYSIDDSFQRRPLSPSPLRQPAYTASETDGTEPQASTSELPVQIRPPAPSPPIDPRTPSDNHDQKFLSPHRSRPTGSPLKLFDNHDTFTSKRLHRRLSQLEDSLVLEQNAGDEAKDLKPPRRPTLDVRLSSVEEASQLSKASPRAVEPEDGVAPSHGSRFGQGELDDHEFPGDISTTSMSSIPASTSSDRSGSPPLSTMPPGAKAPMNFHLASGPETQDTFRGKRKLSKRSTQGSLTVGKRSVDRRPAQLNLKDTFSRREAFQSTVEQETVSVRHEGKRPATSPDKNPTPKRRRTLFTGEHQEVVLPSVKVTSTIESTHDRLQSATSSRKRKDARSDNFSNQADADVLARRRILRPRNPTPSQSGREEIEADVLEATQHFLSSSPRMKTIQEHLRVGNEGDEFEEDQARAIAGEVAAFTLNVSKGISEGERKRSVTTQDFLDEAMKIMDYIRTKGRPASTLEGVEESALEAEQSEIELTRLSFSRPPSREGAISGWRSRDPLELDPEVEQHLRQFQERDDAPFMGSSVRSIHLSNDINPSVTNATAESHPGHIRIFPSPHATAPKTAQDGPDSTSTGASKTQGSHPSLDSALARTSGSNTSRTSQNVATLAPEAVAHLIPGEVCGMTFDKEHGIWVKHKNPKKEPKDPGEVSSVVESEEDPFAQIPDLTIDEAQELRYSGPAPVDRPDANLPSKITGVMLKEFQSPHATVPFGFTSSRPGTQDGAMPQPDMLSSVQSGHSKAHAFASSESQPETRATSWSQPGTMKQGKAKHNSAIPESLSERFYAEEVEHEITIDEDRMDARRDDRRSGSIAVSFSRAHPALTPSRRQTQHSMADLESDVKRLNLSDVQRGEASRQTAHRVSQVDTPVRPHRGAPGSAYLGSARKTLHIVKNSAAELVPTIEEDQELSAIHNKPNNRKASLAVSVAAQVPGDTTALVHSVSSSPARADYTFYLSDLPDFSVNQVDERELPDRNLLGRRGFSRIANCNPYEDRFEGGTAELVKALQDREADQLYWEDLRNLNLHGLGLSTLHKLDVFCDRLERVDVSGNDIRQVTGLPATVRHLNVRNNNLTGISSWAHLPNLQYLDVSGNDINDLECFAGLIHLRQLVVDNNSIENLNGILHLDGLLKLSVRNNKLRDVDFLSAELYRLESLDLGQNELTEVSNLCCLPALLEIQLDGNKLQRLPCEGQALDPCTQLRKLDVSGNGMTFLDVRSFLALRELNVGDNKLISITGLDDLKHLRSFSLRSQRVQAASSKSLSPRIYASNTDVERLCLSANAFTTINLFQDFLNLQNLELASCGLSSLPANLGVLAPNMRRLNLNFNALKDIRPLLNIKRLTHLFLAGNRLSRLRKNSAVLAKLGSLQTLDLRDNPFSVGFYPPTIEGTLTVKGDSKAEDEEPFLLPPREADNDRRYLARLDEDTKLRRRVYEMLMASSCKELENLDGKTFDRREILVKDGIWKRLLELGIVRKSRNVGDEVENGAEISVAVSS